MNGSNSSSFNIRSIRSLGYSDTLSDQEVFNDWYDDIATDQQREQHKDLYSKAVKPTLTSPLLQATGPVDYLKDLTGAFAQSAVPTYQSITTAGRTSKNIREMSGTAGIFNTMMQMSQIEDSPYFGAYDMSTGSRLRADIDYKKFAQDARDIQSSRIAEQVLHNQKTMKEQINNYMENNPKYKAHQEYRAQNPLGFPSNAIEVAEWAGILIPEILPQIAAFKYGGPKGSLAYNAARILGAEIAEDMERNIEAGENPAQAYEKGLVTASVSTAAQAYLENLGLPRFMKKRWGSSATADYLNSFNYKTKKKVFDTLRKVPGFTEKNWRSWSANKWSRVLGGAIKEAATEWTQEVIDSNIDAGMGYGTGQEVFDAMFGEQAKQNIIGGLLGGGAVRAFYTTPQELRFDFDEVIKENSGPTGTNAKNTKIQALKEASDDLKAEEGKLSFAKDQIRNENLIAEAELFKKTLPTKILSDEDYMGAIIKEMEGISRKLPIKINEDKLIKDETNASTAQLIKKNLNSPTHKKLLEVYAKMVKDGKSDNAIFDALNIPKGEVRNSILDSIAKQFKRDYGKLDSSKNNPYVRDKFILQDGMDINTLTEADALALIRATTNDAKKAVIKTSINRAFKGKINEKEINKLVNATYDNYKDNSLEKSIEIKEKKIAKGKQAYIDTKEGKANKRKEEGAIKQNVVVLSKALKPVIIKDPIKAWDDIKRIAVSPGQHQTIIGVINKLSKSEFKSLIKNVPELIELVNNGSIAGKDLAADKKIAASVLIGQDIPEVVSEKTPPHQRNIVSQTSIDKLEAQMESLREQLVDYGEQGDQDGIKTTKEQIAALQAKIDGDKPKVVEGTLDANKAPIKRMEAANAKLLADLRAGKEVSTDDLKQAGIKTEDKKQNALDDMADNNNLPKQNNNETWEQNEAIADQDAIEEINDLFKEDPC